MVDVLDHHVLAVLGRRPLASIRRSDVEALRASLKLALSTVATVHQHLGQVLARAYRGRGHEQRSRTADYASCFGSRALLAGLRPIQSVVDRAGNIDPCAGRITLAEYAAEWMDRMGPT